MTNKWRRRARKWRKEANSYKGYYIDTDLVLKTERIQNALLTERINKELARVQGVCEATQAQVLKHSATIVNLRERENEALKESEGLLAWQRRVREAWDSHLKYGHLDPTMHFLRQAIEAGAEPKGET